jgi:ribonuclease E
MSRQRLRPALSEGASIPCPRCGGSGHIRDTESSALQILRVIQEESLKDSTASVLCQVPVEVASFLLNEKRAEISKIEMKQRINVLMVPNKSLETPNYKLERLKHDDPRLDNIEASYKLAEVMEDPTTVTRRSQERSNKQEPIIKGVLPDQPAPVAPPPVVKPVAPAPVAAKPAAPAPVAETGFFGWLKSLFGASPEAAPVAPKPETTDKDTQRDQRPPRGGRGDGRGEGRGDGRGEGRGDGRGEGRGGRGGRGGRDEAPRTEGQGQGRGGRGGRGPREGQGQRNERDGETRPLNAIPAPGSDNLPTPTLSEEDARGGPQRQERPARGAERSERGGRGRNRGERGHRNENGASGSPVGNETVREQQQPMAEAYAPSAAPELTESSQTLANANVDEGGVQNESPREGSGTSGRRERRPRNRGGRDRADRPSEETASRELFATPEAAMEQSGAEVAEPALTAPIADTRTEVQEVSAVPAAAVQAPAVIAPVAAPVEAPAAALPQVQAFALPVDKLAEVAQQAGLVWVNSDAEKIAAVQAAIAATPAPVHAPRERPPAVVVDAGPLVLVETRRQLGQDA